MLSDADLWDDEPDLPTLPRWIEDLTARAERPTTHADGVALQWHVWGDGTPVLLLHGGHGSWLHWARNVQPLVDAGHRVMAVDLPSFGQSDFLDTDDLEDIARLTAHGAAELSSGTPLCVAGFSFGSVVGAILEKHTRDGIAHLAMLGSPALGQKHGVGDQLAKWRGMPIPHHRAAAHAQNVGALMLTGPDSVTDEATAIQMAHAELARGRYRGLFDKLNLPRDLKALTGDLTVIYGDRDALTWRHLEERRERVMRWNDNAEFHVIPGAGHWVQYQAADVVNDILVRRFA